MDGVCGCDWIAGSIPMEKFESFRAFLNDLYQIEPDVQEKSIQLYDSFLNYHPFGCSVYFDSSEDRCKRLHGGRFAVRFSGSGLAMFTANGLYKLFYELIYNYWCTLTRVDLNYDDFSKRKMPYEIAEVANQGNYSGYKRHEHRCPRKRSGEILGDTLYFGRRGKLGSGRFLRIYDKNLESKGEVDCVRYEVEFTKEKAQKIGFRLASAKSVDEMAGIICALIGGSINFIQRKGKNLNRATRMEWWQGIVDLLGSIQLRNPVRVQTIEKSKRHYERTSASLAMLRLAYGEAEFMGWLMDLLDVEEDDLPDRHKRLLEAYRVGENLDEVPF